MRRRTRLSGSCHRGNWAHKSSSGAPSHPSYVSITAVYDTTAQPFVLHADGAYAGGNNPDERGWRQNFNNAGFPGIDKEAVELLSFLEEGDVTGTVVDLSCGSGLMTRRLVSPMIHVSTPNIHASTHPSIRADASAAPSPTPSSPHRRSSRAASRA